MNMNKYFPVFIWMLFSWMPVFSQEAAGETHQCITPSLDAELRQQHPEWPSNAQFETWLQEKMAHSPERSGIRQVLTIPVVVHVIHNGEPVGTGANIAASRVESQMRVLEEDYRKLAGTPGDNNNPVGVDTEIEFCLAYVGPDGRVLPESGIDRINRHDAGFSDAPFSTNYITNVIKTQTIWDETQYMNIWVVESISPAGVAGFATLPTAPEGLEGLGNGFPGIDGLVVSMSNFGRQGSSTGRTATHEIGHWLGLLHVSGPYNAGNDPRGQNSCSTDDFCDDTPNMSGTNQGCSPSFTCGSNDPIDNYMVGTLGPCRKTFTRCQADRMRTVLQNSPRRVELLSSTVCQRPTAPPVANFSTGDTVVCDGRVQFMDASTDLPTDWLWTFSDGSTSDQRNPVFHFDSSGTYTINLSVWNELGFSEITKTVQITVSGGSLEAGDPIQTCLGDQVQLNAQTSAQGGTLFWFPETGLSDPSVLNPVLTANSTRAYTLTIQLDNGCELKDTLVVDAAPKPTTLALPTSDPTIDKGQSIQLNAIGAEHYQWSPAAGLSDPNIPNPIATPDTTTLYTVTGFNDAGCSKTDQVLITVNDPTAIGDKLWEAVGQVQPPYPNPAESSMHFAAQWRQAGMLQLDLIDLTGRRVARLYQRAVLPGNWQLDWQVPPSIAKGVYLLSWKMNGRRFFQKIQLF